MKDIKKAVEAEKEYIAHRIKGEEPFHLVDAVKECGFETLEEYFAAKREHELSALSFEAVETTPTKAIADVLETIARKKTRVLFADTKFTIVWNGDGSEFDREYCAKHGIPVLPIQTAGGTIVSTKGDLNIGICLPAAPGVEVEDVLRKLAEIFRKRTDKSVEIDGNDILIGGHKVLGCSAYRTNGMFMFITPVSFSDKSELIGNICTKRSGKTAGHIDFMSAEELRTEVAEWLKVRSI